MNDRWQDVISGSARWAVVQGDCLDVLREMPDGCVDAVVTDPPYAEIDRPYGRMTEDEWRLLMDAVVVEVRRVLKPSGSAALILQPNSEHVGKMRAWLYEFEARMVREWNIVQDAYWWNHTTPPTVHCRRSRGLMRPSVKHIVWLGSPDCYRNQDAVLWTESAANAATDLEDRALRRYPSGQSVRPGRAAAAAKERGGVTPFNLLPVANADSSSGGVNGDGHGASTPRAVCDYWTRYICPPGGIVLDPFAGRGNVGMSVVRMGRLSLNIDRDPEYAAIARARIEPKGVLL